MIDWSLDFSTNNSPTYSYVVRPAEVPVKIDHLPDRVVHVVAGNERHGYAMSGVAIKSGKGTASVLPLNDFDDVLAFGSSGALVRSEVEWRVDAGHVSAGATAPTVELDWSKPLRAYLAGPQCQHSGPGGRKVTLLLKGWPTGESASFVASDDGGYYATSGPVTSSGPTTAMAKTFRVDAHAPVGDWYVNTNRSDDPDSIVEFEDVYQVCALRASASSVPAGSAVRLSGQVPGMGIATLYSIAHKAGQPATLAAKGWHKVGTLKLNYTTGKFVSGRLHPSGPPGMGQVLRLGLPGVHGRREGGGALRRRASIEGDPRPCGLDVRGGRHASKRGVS